MIGILGGMGTRAGLDFCNKLAKLNVGKTDQNYPLFLLYNKSNIPKRPENLNRYNYVLKSLIKGCNLLKKNKCKFIVMPCNTAHHWHEDLQKKIKIPIISMPREVYLHTKKTCKKNSKIGILCTEATLKTKVYSKYFHKYFPEYKYISPQVKLPSYGLQAKVDAFNGMCVTYCIMYLHYRVINPHYSQKYIIKQMKKINKTFLLKYAKYVEDMIK